MNDTQDNEFSGLLKSITQILNEGVPARHAPRLACIWGHDPGEHRLECHWVTELPQD